MRILPVAFLAVLILISGTVSGTDSASPLSPAWDLLWNNDFTGAVKAFQSTLRDERDDPEALRGLMLAQVALGDDRGLVESLATYLEGARHSQYDDLLLDWIAENTDLEGKSFRKDMAEFGRQLADDPEADPVARRWLAARELRLVRLLGDRKRILKCASPLDRITDWTLLGPFDNTSGSGHRKDHVQDFRYNPLYTYSGKFGQPINWFHPQVHSLGGEVVPNLHFHRKEFTTAFAQTRVRIAESGSYLLSLGYHGDVDLFLNGELFRQCSREVGGEEALHWLVDLPPGWLQIVVKISGREESPWFTCALTHPDGSPIENLETQATGHGHNPPGGIKVRPAPNPILARIAENAVGPEAAFWNILRGRIEDESSKFKKHCAAALVIHPDCSLIRLAIFRSFEPKRASRSASLDEILGLAPDLAPALLFKAGLELEKGRGDEARKILDSGYRQGAASLSAMLCRIESYEQSGLWEDVKSSALQAARSFPGEPGPYRALVRFDEESDLVNDLNDHRRNVMALSDPITRLLMRFHYEFNQENFGDAKGAIEDLMELPPSTTWSGNSAS